MESRVVNNMVFELLIISCYNNHQIRYSEA